VIRPRTLAEIAYAHGWHVRMADEETGAEAAALSLLDRSIVAQALGAEHAAAAEDGWRAAESFLVARKFQGIPGNSRKYRQH